MLTIHESPAGSACAWRFGRGGRADRRLSFFVNFTMITAVSPIGGSRRTRGARVPAAADADIIRHLSLAERNALELVGV